jgi:hypothetical protein
MIGKGAYFSDQDIFRAWVDENFPVPLILAPAGGEELVVETKLESLREETEILPTEWPD